MTADVRMEEKMGILLTEGAETAAQGAEQVGGTSLLMMVVIYGALFFAMWFFLFRPQSKEKKKMAAMLSMLAIGDVVMTTSGFYGVVIDISNEDNTVIVEFGNNKNCRIPMDKQAISRVEKPGEA